MIGSVNNQVTVAGKTFNAQRTVTSDGAVIVDPALAAAVAGSLSTRTDNDTGVLALASGHGVTTGARLDLYWSGGKRYGMTVGAVSGTSVPVDGGAGDNLPTAATSVTAMVPQLEDFAVDAADLQALLVGCDSPAVVVIRDGSAATIAAIYVSGSTGAYQWDSGSGVANPFDTDNAVDVYVSHGGTASKQVNLVAQRN